MSPRLDALIGWCAIAAVLLLTWGFGVASIAEALKPWPYSWPRPLGSQILGVSLGLAMLAAGLMFAGILYSALPKRSRTGGAR